MHALQTAHAPQLDAIVPQTRPSTGNPELRQAVPLSTRYVYVYIIRAKTPTLKREKIKQRITEKTPEIVLSHSRRKKKLCAHDTRDTHCTDPAQTSTTAVSGRHSSVGLLSVCANGARTKRCERKSTKKITNTTYADAYTHIATRTRLEVAFNAIAIECLRKYVFKNVLAFRIKN